MRLTLTSASLALAVLGSALWAQTAPGSYVAAANPVGTVGGGLFLIDPIKGTMTPITGVSGDLRWAQSIDQNPRVPTTFYVGTNGADQSPAVDPNIYLVLATAGKVISTKKLNTVALKGDSRVLDLVTVGKEIIFLTNTRLGRIPTAGGAPTTIITHSVRCRS